MAEPKAPLSIRVLPSFDGDFARVPKNVQAKASEQLLRLAARDVRHPSLGFKKMAGRTGIWEAGVTRNYRMTFELTDEEVILRRIGTHDILKKS